MNINDAAKLLLGYFAPEERSIPDSVTYPGRNAAVMKAMNDALQDLFGTGGPWVREEPRGAAVNIPVVTTMTIQPGATTGTIPEEAYRSWFPGSTIHLGGKCCGNMVKAVTQAPSNPLPEKIRVQLYVPDYGNVDFEMTWEGSLYAALAITEGNYLTTLSRSEWGENEGKWAFVFMGPPLEGVLDKGWISTNVAESPLEVEGWEPTGFEDDTPVLIESLDPILYSLTLVAPHVGETDTVEVKIFNDCITLASDVFHVHEPVKLGCRDLKPVNSRDGHARGRTDDYGFRGLSGGVGAAGNFHVESVALSNTVPPTRRLRIIPPPSDASTITYNAMLTPPVVTSLASTSDLPIPFGFMDSVFIPIAVKKLRSCPFWRGVVGDDQVNADYQDALTRLKDADPQRDSGITMKFEF